jgi:hypothetical protein
VDGEPWGGRVRGVVGAEGVGVHSGGVVWRVLLARLWQ